jgi:alpha-tubulin suppressor-like RCC1 family protein
MAANITTLAFSNVPASGTPLQLVLVFRNAADGANYQVTWPSSIYWNSVAPATNSLIGPTLVAGGNTVTVISLLTTDGGTKWRGWVEASIPGQAAGNNQLYSWGNGYSGQLGQGGTGSAAYRSSPVQVGSLQTWATVSTSSYGGAAAGGILTTGQLYMWGGNGDGGLGLNDTASPRTTPTPVGNLLNWAKLRVSDNHCVSIKTDGTLWTWGANSQGQLGQNDTVKRSSPVQVGALTTWAQAVTMYLSVLAIKTDGTLWSWGWNNNGQLGLGDTAPRSSPVQVGALTNWSKLNSSSSTYSAAAAIKTDGTLWTWGRNNTGQLGHGNTTNYSSPKQVGALTTWSSVSIAGNASVVSTSAVKTDGTLWTWGSGLDGALGRGNTTSYSSPQQLGALTNWSKTNGGLLCMSAVKTDGTLWAWGANSAGQLGLGNVIRRSSPVQVGAETYWADLSMGTQQIFALRASTVVNPA